MYAGAAHADSSEYQPCIALWNYALQLKIHKELDTAPVAKPNKLILAIFFEITMFLFLS
jgi:hypothetical protein